MPLLATVHVPRLACTPGCRAKGTTHGHSAQGSAQMCIVYGLVSVCNHPRQPSARFVNRRFRAKNERIHRFQRLSRNRETQRPDFCGLLIRLHRSLAGRLGWRSVRGSPIAASSSSNLDEAFSFTMASTLVLGLMAHAPNKWSTFGFCGGILRRLVGFLMTKNDTFAKLIGSERGAAPGVQIRDEIGKSKCIIRSCGS